MLTEVRTRYKSKEVKLSIGSDIHAMTKGITRVIKLGRSMNSKWCSLGDVQDAYNNRI